jgi:hypothetical protein
VTRVTEDGLGELLSIFPLTVAVQRIALEAAETLGVNPIARSSASTMRPPRSRRDDKHSAPAPARGRF